MSMMDDNAAPAGMSNTVPDDQDLPAMAPDGMPAPAAKPSDAGPDESVKAQVKKIIAKIRGDKAHHKKAFARMKRDQFMAMWGREETWSEKNYKANIAGRHVKQKTATLYAKNPKSVARRAEKLDFAIWDEDPQSIMQAMQAKQQDAAAQQAHAQAQAVAVAAVKANPIMASVMMGHNGGPPMAAPSNPLLQPFQPTMQAPGPAALPNTMTALQPYQPSAAAVDADALLADFQQGMERRKQVDKIGKTLEILYSKALRDQQPIDFKMAAKQLVRRTCTTGVGYIELGFQREYGPRPGMTEILADAKARLDHLRVLAEDVQSGDIGDTDAEKAELEASLAELQSEPEILIREGLIFDYPRSTKVIPDRLCKTLVGFIGSRHLTIEYEYTLQEIRELFDVDLKDCANFTPEGKSFDEVAGGTFDEDGETTNAQKGSGLVRVWKHYDKPSGLVYLVADGHHAFLREPAAPDVFVNDFWPVYALTFNEVENEDELFPPSDVFLLTDMQNEHNRSRQGKREHREAARPRWGFANGVMEDEDVERVKKMKPFDTIGFNIDPTTELAKVFQSMPVPGVDPNLYDTQESSGDAQLVVGAQVESLGGGSSGSATQSALSANSTSAGDASSIDDLDAFMTIIARSAGQIFLREMSEETVMAQVGPGAFWPHATLAEIAGEVFLEVEAGSMGKPNQAVEVNNWKQMLPLLIQMGGIKPLWLAKETLRRLDDRMDLTDAVAAGIPSIASMNQMPQPSAAGAVQQPGAQGAAGANNAPTGPSVVQPGSDAPMGNNRI